MFVGLLQKHRHLKLRNADDGAGAGGDAGSGSESGGDPGGGSEADGRTGDNDGSAADGDGTGRSEASGDGADSNEGGEAKPEGAPEEYTDFIMPEGFPVDEALMNDFKPLAKELGLPQDQAQKLVDLYGSKVAPLMIQRQQDAWNQQLETWVNECKADKEIGGDRFEAAVSDAQRVINTIGTPELKQVFDQYGLGNNPELVRAFSRMAKYLKEDSLETGGNTAQQSDVAKRFYPNMA